MQDRLLNNIRILNELITFSLAHPELRFIQILWALKIIDRDKNFYIKDRFYEEPEETLIRLRETVHEKNKTSEKGKEAT